MSETVRRLVPGRNETQVWENSAERNPPAKSVAKLRARQAEIRRGNGSAKDASRAAATVFPPREIPGVA
jgi:hypothetical protein